MITLSFFSCLNAQTKLPPPINESANEPVKYIGAQQTDPKYFDGALPHVVGAHHYQAFQANRKYPSDPGEVGWTYSHQPYLCYWNGKFYLQYLSDVIAEHTPPGRTLIMTSEDGRTWTNPVVAFPIYSLPEIVIKGKIYIAAGTPAVMHQRMGFYVAPNGRLLTFGFYGYCPTSNYSPNSGNGLGRVVREIYKDGNFGPIYFIRYNRHAGFNESNTNFPYYKTSDDKGFVESCESILADKLMSLQWWEEDRGKDGFYKIDPGDVKGAYNFTFNMTTSAGAGKALSYYFRPDGVAVALWKNRYAALSADKGLTWTPISLTPTIIDCGAKTWGQQTKDGLYALVYNHNKTGERYPMVIMIGQDGYQFDNMLCLQGEVPPMRYTGAAKDIGPQYIRGILPGNGNPPGNYLWNVYSMNKEDIWFTRTHLPIKGTVEEYVNENFNNAKTEADLELWNLYMPKCAPISVVAENENPNGNCIQFKDYDRYDYALAERVFLESKKIKIQFDLKPEQNDNGRIEIDVVNATGTRPVQIVLSESGKIQAANGKNLIDLESYKANTMLIFKIEADATSKKYNLYCNNKELLKAADFAEQAGSMQRIVFRTGKYRGLYPEHEPKEKDLRDAGEPIKESVFYLDNVTINN